MGDRTLGIQHLSVKNYDFPLERIPALSWTKDNKEILEHIKERRPVLIRDSEITSSALKWDLTFLKQNLGNAKHVVWLSKTSRFKFWSDKIARQIENKIPFVAPTRSTEMTITEFVQRIENWKRGKEKVYLQQQLTDGVGPAIYADFVRIGWDKLDTLQKTGNWGPLTTNLLLISQKESLTPVHYDEQENLFAQLVGSKRFLLFPPEAAVSLYPHPVLHPHDRQSQVELENPDYKRFPRLRDLHGFEAQVGPGDLIYIPNCWWHQVETLSENSVSLTFWYKATPVSTNVEYPLSWGQKLTIMRNVEKMIGEALKDPAEIAPFMQAMVLGRYTDLA